MANFKKKPTIKEIANVVVNINNRVNEIANVVSNLDNVIGMYIRMEGKLEDFNKYLEKKAKEMEDDKKKDGKPDTKDIQPDSGNEGSGSKGVRKKDK
tara:strand:- start:4695 stop:4985 length:291 start_codon:yes stop_codon:yes gene_type:complete